MSRLAGKVAVVTGGSSGIGLATAKRFVEEGAYVFITGRRQAELDAAKASIGGNVTAIQGDVTQLPDIARLAAVVQDTKGVVDVVFANAGSGQFSSFGEITLTDYDFVFNLNVRGVLFSVQAMLPLLRDGSSIIINGSIAGSKGIPGFTLYGAAKAAVRSFARTWTIELKARGIRTNILSPGPVRTPPFEAASKDVADGFIRGVPLGRAALPEEIAAVAVFLASDESSYVTGIELFADGGMAQV